MMTNNAWQIAKNEWVTQTIWQRCHVFSYFGNNIGMTPTYRNTAGRLESEFLQSRELSKQLAQSVSLLLNLEARPIHHLAKGVTLVKAGEQVRRLPFLLSGHLEVVVHLTGGKGGQVVPIAFHAGEIAFLSHLFNPLPSGGDLIVGSTATIQWLPLPEMEAAILKDQDLLLGLVRFLGQRLRELQKRERGWAERGVLPRLRAGLLRMIADMPGRNDGRVVVEMTHEQLAARCGISRPKASIALKSMAQGGILTLGRKSIEIVDVELLIAQSK
jgi:CRP-like cAMP-binding protein